MKRVLFFAVVLFIFSCEPRQGQQAQELPPKAPTSSTSMHEIIAKEVIQAKSYTYVRGDENGNEVWIAILKRDVEIGKTYYYGQSMEMKGFKSKELERTFDSILFLEGISDSPDGKNTTKVMAPKDDVHQKKSSVPRTEMNIKHEEGETEVGYLYDNKESLSGKKVKVRGMVTKFNPDIMDRNWVHIQDGTGSMNTFDLTITTNDHVKIGDVVSFEGIVAVDKDFGHGYKYNLILEEASLQNQKPDVMVN